MAHGVELDAVVLDRRAPVAASPMNAAAVVLDAEQPERPQPPGDSVRLRALEAQVRCELDRAKGDATVPGRVVEVAGDPMLGRAQDHGAAATVPCVHSTRSRRSAAATVPRPRRCLDSRRSACATLTRCESDV